MSASDGGSRESAISARSPSEPADITAENQQKAPVAEIRLSFKYKARSQESWERAANLKNKDRRKELDG